MTTQLTELGIPVVIAINMMDVVKKNGDKINVPELSRELGCKVVEISALKGDGVMEAAEAAMTAGEDSFEYTDEQGETDTYLIKDKNGQYTIQRYQETRVIDSYAAPSVKHWCRRGCRSQYARGAAEMVRYQNIRAR